MGYRAWSDFSILVYVAINLSICELGYKRLRVFVY